MAENFPNPYVNFTIAVCDDEKSSTVILSGLIEKALFDSNFKYEIQAFYNGRDLLKKIDEIDLVFLDVDMPNEDGLFIGGVISERRPKCKIVMATGRDDCFKGAFKINALRYITKPFDEKEVYEAVWSFVDTRPGQKYTEAYLNRNIYQIRQSEIQYIRAMDSYSEIVVRNHVLRTEKSLAILEKELDSSIFYRIHKQYIVNMAFVESRKKDSVVIQGVELGVAKRKRADFEMKYIEYDLKFR